MHLKPALHLVGLLLTWFFENVLKARDQYNLQDVFCCAIDLNFRLTESWGESKNDSKGEVACPSSSGRALKKKRLLCMQARINKARGTMP